MLHSHCAISRHNISWKDQNMSVAVQRPQNPSWEGFICKIPQKCCSSSNPPSPSSSLAPAAAPPSSSYQSQSLYTLLPPSPTRHLKNTTIIPALLCLHTCFVCIRFFPLLSICRPSKIRSNLAGECGLTPVLQLPLPVIMNHEVVEIFAHSKHPTILLYKLHVGSKYATRAI